MANQESLRFKINVFYGMKYTFVAMESDLNASIDIFFGPLV